MISQVIRGVVFCRLSQYISNWEIFGFLYGYPKIFVTQIANLLTHAPQIMYLFCDTLKAPLT